MNRVIAHGATAILLAFALASAACGGEEGGTSNSVDTSPNNSTSANNVVDNDAGMSGEDASTSTMEDAGNTTICLNVPAELTAPETLNDQTSTVEIVLENCGDVELVVTSGITGDAEWTLSDSSVTIAANDTASLAATYSPRMLNATSEAVVSYDVAGEDFADKTALRGTSVLNPENCPVPAIQARELGEMMWQDPLITKSLGVVELDGTMTTGVADIVEYSWSIVGAPTDSTATLTDGLAATTTLDLDYPGTYSVELSVADAEGRRCEPARFEFVAVATDGIVIELEWDTVGGAGASTSDSDLDLYLAHELANDWDDSFWSIFRDHTSEDWSVGAVPANFELLGDSVDDGSETIRASRLPPARFYIGVYAYQIAPATPPYEAFATIRVFVDGAKSFETSTASQSLNTTGLDDGLLRREFWTVVRIDSTQTPPVFTEIARLDSSFPRFAY